MSEFIGSRLETAVQEAEQALFKTLYDEFPEFKGQSLPPDLSTRLEHSMREWVWMWVCYNKSHGGG